MFVLLYYYLTSRFKIVFIWLGSPLSRIAKRFTRGLWVGEVERLERRLEESNSELELTRSRSREAQQSKELLQRRVDQLSGRVDKTEYERVLRENNDLRAHLGMVEADARQRTADFERAIARATKKHGDLEGLLEARSKELQEAQAYVTKLDEVADSEVVGIVEPLNGQIFQAAASLTDVEEFHFDNPCKDSATVAGAKSRLATSSWVGSELLDVLGDWSHVEHSVFVQLAIQAGLATYARQVANSWDPTNTRDTTILESLYALIREREPQSVAARWRVLGRRHLQGLPPSADYVPSLVSQLSDVVTDILLAAGATAPRDVVANIVSTEFESDLREIVTLALHFRNTAGERVLSRDFALFAAEPGEPFDGQRMEAQHHQEAFAQRARVLGTTQLGLLSERSVEKGGRRDDLEVRRAVLLKCMVALQDGSEQVQDHGAAVEDSHVSAHTD